MAETAGDIDAREEFASDMLHLLQDCRELLDAYSDVNDGDDGQPVPNRAMSMISRINELIGED